MNPAAGRRIIKVSPGEHYVTAAAEEAIATVLGSCVAACIRDPVAGIGGLNHFMLPESREGVWGTGEASLRYGNFAMDRLIDDILRRGGQRPRLEVKLFGGAQLAQDRGQIGGRNVSFVDAYLKQAHISPVVRQLGGRQARRILYMPVSGQAFMMLLPDAPARQAWAPRGAALDAGPLPAAEMI
ncbi:chemotaxis protein CheD [Falsiroseomonas sp.]|uniref:chemotaxis protein CheD n=1 Tax=Falsiroseomonas sp. TaxID=2870721 RepID=UPI003F72C890